MPCEESVFNNETDKRRGRGGSEMEVCERPTNLQSFLVHPWSMPRKVKGKEKIFTIRGMWLVSLSRCQQHIYQTCSWAAFWAGVVVGGIL